MRSIAVGQQVAVGAVDLLHARPHEPRELEQRHAGGDRKARVGVAERIGAAVGEPCSAYSEGWIVRGATREGLGSRRYRWGTGAACRAWAAWWGVGDWPAEDGFGSGPIDVEQWRRLEDPASRIIGPIVVGFDVGPNKQSSVAIAGLRDDGLVHVGDHDHRLTTGELVQRIVQLANGRDPWKIIVDAFGVAGQVVAQLEEQGVEVHRVTGGEHAEAVGVLMEEVYRGDAAASRLGGTAGRGSGREAAVDGRRALVVAAALEHRHLPAGRRLSGGLGGAWDARGRATRRRSSERYSPHTHGSV